MKRTLRFSLIALAALGGGTIGCFSAALTLGDECTLNSDCGWHGECEQGFCGGCNVIEQDPYACLCTVDLAWSNPEEAYNGCFAGAFPAPEAPVCLSNKCVVKDDEQPRCNFAYATEAEDEKGRKVAVSVTIPNCNAAPYGSDLCFNLLTPISPACKASGSNVEVTFEYDKDVIGATISTLGVTCEFEADSSKCESGSTDPCHSIELASDQTMASGDTALVTGGSESLNCDGAGPEVVFRWTPPSAGTYIFDTAGSDFDTVLYVRETSCTGTELGCNDDNSAGDSGVRTSRLVVPDLSTDTEMFIFVDSYYATGGHFVLTITYAGEL